MWKIFISFPFPKVKENKLFPCFENTMKTGNYNIHPSENESILVCIVSCFLSFPL